ncbi:MAG: hypothetical protein HY875_03650 [Chloroflexi bacterium]|nr:hypothetical protein [Chloroflexota bacterium]
MNNRTVRPSLRHWSAALAAIAALVLGISIARAVNPKTTYGWWGCSYDETAGFNSYMALTTVTGACAEQYFTSGWYWDAGISAYVPFGPENWQDVPIYPWRAYVTTTKMYGYGQIRDTAYQGGADSPTLEAFAN